MSVLSHPQASSNNSGSCIEVWMKTSVCTLWTAEQSEHRLSGVAHKMRHFFLIICCRSLNNSSEMLVQIHNKRKNKRPRQAHCVGLSWCSETFLFALSACTFTPGGKLVVSLLHVMTVCLRYRQQITANACVSLCPGCRREDVQVRPVRLHLQEEGHAQRAHPGGSWRPQKVQVWPVWEGLRHPVCAKEPQKGE